ncbi:hypothetical protein [Petroclostridium sp. X23]|jgi:release factor H-coupled RctB family protein|uniref:hypothetical protein n=1 Tax=Petroclostridium sp. X23 TaxID=3045146 RepID=UPI0024AD4104|nr:hypothetical protein [Petroclostridium sp. X23]WHH58576.1 hypothetical protein QKW49_22730 [Petroclostridium sp. X23]
MQLNALSELDGVRKVVGLPDLHAGKSPVGVVNLAKGHLWSDVRKYLLSNEIYLGLLS